MAIPRTFRRSTSRLCILTLALSALVASAVGAQHVSTTTDMGGQPGDPGFIKFSGAAFPVAEEDGEVLITVRRQGGSTGVVTVAYQTTAGSAEEGVDYVSTSGSLEWADGDRESKTFVVEILDDEVDEGQETIGLLLSEPSGGADLSPPSTAVVRIKPSDRSEGDDDDGGGDDDGDEDPSGVIKLTREKYVAFESSQLATFGVEREDGSSGEVSVEYMTLDGSATDGVDYTGATGVLTWADGEQGEQTIDLVLVDDSEEEATETITVVLTNVTGGAELGRRDTASIQIIDDDRAEGLCVSDEETLCLGNGRFQVTGQWTDFDGNTGAFQMVAGTDDSGFAWFFDEDNLELLIKVLHGCPINGHYWVFFAATTNVAFTIEVTDLESGEVRIYSNPLGVSPETTTDTTAFATCS